MCKIPKLVALSAIGFFLTACASAEEQHQADLASCQRYGFVQGTPEFAHCMQQEQLARSQGTYSPAGVGVGIGGGSYGGGGFGGAGIGFGF